MTTGDFPQRLSLTSNGPFARKILVFIGEPGAEPTYTLNADGFFGKMTLHKGPTEEGMTLVTAAEEKKGSDHFIVDLPPIPDAGVEECQEIVRHMRTLKSGTFWFGVAVGEGEKRHVERFEWRHTRGAEVKSMGQGSQGWKLVRLEDPNASKGNGGKDGFTSEGHEVVAIWAQSKAFSSLKNQGEFRFMGSGANGELGRQWSFMAVMSCFCIWLRDIQEAIITSAST